MLTKDDIQILVDIVIVNSTSADLFLRSCATQGFVAFGAAQAMKRSYCNRHPTDQFLPLAIEIFGYLHKHANVFLHDCTNVIWSLKRREGLHLSTLIVFLCKKVSITLQRMQTSSILSRAIAIELTTS